MMKLSHRLETVASFVSQGSRVADIGTDHGYVPIYLVKNQMAESAIAMDVRPGPLERAKNHIREYDLTEKIETRLSDGLEKLMPGEADGVIIAGMGGELMIHILEDGSHVRESVKEWILSPQSGIALVRRYLRSHGLSVIRETMVKEEGKYYTIMKAVPGESGWKELETEEGCTVYDLYGELLIRENNPVLAAFLEQEKVQVLQILAHLEQQKTEGSEERKKELQGRLQLIEEAQHEMQTAD